MKIAIIGGGNMGSTYAKAFIQSNIVKKESLLIIEKHSEKIEELKRELGVTIQDDLAPNMAEFDIIIVAVKPQDFRVLAATLNTYLNPKQLIISIMAGITIEKITSLLAHGNVIRAMPNTPAQLGYGITGFSAAAGVTDDDINTIKILLETTGKAIFMKDENMLDAVTALSGSGPAYFYYFVKYMIEAGKQMGMDEAIAATLVKQTMLGSFQIMNNSTLSLDEMIRMVASKGGTTEAALKSFDANNVGNHIVEALQAAESRAKDLSQGA